MNVEDAAAEVVGDRQALKASKTYQIDARGPARVEEAATGGRARALRDGRGRQRFRRIISNVMDC